MPNLKIKKKTSDIKSTPYTRVTPRSFNQFTLFKSHNITNGTKTTRTPSDYAERLGLKSSLKEYIIQFAKEKGRKITILDAGCGKGVTIDQLLSDKALDNYIERIHGISLHYFNDIESVMKKHSSRFYYYSGTAQTVLAKAPETFNAYDLIMDVWGAYPYSADKLELLQRYHQALKPGGIARVYSTQDADLQIKQQNAKQLTSCFPKWAADKYPETFACANVKPNTSAIIMKKSSIRWPIDSYDILSSQKKSVLSNIKHLNTKELQKKNALKYSKVVIQPHCDQQISLRQLSFKK